MSFKKLILGDLIQQKTTQDEISQTDAELALKAQKEIVKNFLDTLHNIHEKPTSYLRRIHETLYVFQKNVHVDGIDSKIKQIEGILSNRNAIEDDELPSRFCNKDLLLPLSSFKNVVRSVDAQWLQSILEKPGHQRRVSSKGRKVYIVPKAIFPRFDFDFNRSGNALELLKA